MGRGHVSAAPPAVEEVAARTSTRVNMRASRIMSGASASSSALDGPPRPLRVLLLLLGCALGQPPAKVLEEYSFRAPYTDINPFTGQRQIANWDLGGTATAHRSFVRLTAEAQGSKGWMTSHNPLTLTEWSAMLELRASGNSPHLYGDGMAIWLVKASDHIEGPVFGREDKWNGLGIFFDTFQNVDHSHHHKHPYIYAVINDGTMHYVPDADVSDPAKQALPGAKENSGCSFDFRYAEMNAIISPRFTKQFAEMDENDGCDAGTMRRAPTCRCSTTRAST